MTTNYKTPYATRHTRYTRRYPTAIARGYRPESPARSVRLARTLLIIVLGILIGATWTTLSSPAATTPATNTGSYVYVTVPVGGTLWGIAQEYFPDRDPRDVVAELTALNAIGPNGLQAGQMIALPRP